MEKEKNVIIKRKKYHTYREEDIICTESSKEIARQQNLNIRNRWGSKQYNYNGQKIKIIRWEFYNQNGEFIKAKNII